AIEADTIATHEFKLDSVQQGAEQVVESTLHTGPRPPSAIVLDPAPVVSVPASYAIEAPLNTQVPVAPPLAARPQLAAANDAVIPGTASATAPASTPVVQAPSQPVAQVADLDIAPPPTLIAKEPQQLLVEQALGNSTSGDRDVPAEVTRQPLVPTSPPLRPAPPTMAPLQAADPNFANVASMLNQGQAMNSLNERLQFMLLNGQNSAEIQLDPPELGSLQVRVTTRHEQTSVIFVAPNNAVRDALELQLPRLRDTLEGAGLQLQDADVFAQTDDKPGTQPQSYADAEAAEQLIEDELDDGGSKTSSAQVSLQLVDAYV
ncbi:MAG: flagellar hook-length control protein FliK, partial [Pseudomonadales bacterium]